MPLKTNFPVKSKDVVVEIAKKHLKVGLKGHPPIIDGELRAEIKKEDASWVIQDRKDIVLSLEKVSYFRFFIKISHFLPKMTKIFHFYNNCLVSEMGIAAHWIFYYFKIINIF